MDKINLKIWREGEPKWTWPEGETVPRYMHSQITRESVVNMLNGQFKASDDEIVSTDNQLQPEKSTCEAKREQIVFRHRDLPTGQEVISKDFYEVLKIADRQYKAQAGELDRLRKDLKEAIHRKFAFHGKTGTALHNSIKNVVEEFKL